MTLACIRPASASMPRSNIRVSSTGLRSLLQFGAVETKLILVLVLTFTGSRS